MVLRFFYFFWVISGQEEIRDRFKYFDFLALAALAALGGH